MGAARIIDDSRPHVQAGVLDGDALQSALARQQIREAFEAAKARARAWDLPPAPNGGGRRG